MTTRFIQKLSLMQKERFIIYLGLSFVAGLISAVMAFLLDPIYVLFGLGGIIFAYLFLFHIEVAIIIFLLVQNQLSQYNSLGGGGPFHPNGLLGVVIILSTIWYFLTHPFDRSRLRGNTAMLGFLFLCIMQLVISGISGNSTHLMDQVNVTLRLLASISIYMIIFYKVDTMVKAQWVIAVVVAAQLLPTINGLLIALGAPGFSFFQYAETARLGNSGVGVYLAMILMLCLVFYLNTPKGPGRIIWGSLSAFYSIGLLFSYGRSGWISFVVGLAIIGILKHRKLLFMLPFLLLMVIGYIPAVTERFADTSTFSQRVEIWRAAFGIFANHPIFGTGYGTGLFLVGDTLRQYNWRIHNDYVSVLLETGIVGLILFLIWHGHWLTSLYRNYKKATNEYYKTFALAVFMVLLISLVSRFTDNLLVDSFKMYPLSALIATVFALPQIRVDKALSQNSIIEGIS